MGRGASQKRMLRAEYPAKWEMAGRARPCPGQKIRVVTNGSIITIAPVAFDRELCRYTK